MAHRHAGWSTEIENWRSKIQAFPQTDSLRYLTIDFLNLMHSVIQHGPTGETLARQAQTLSKVLRRTMKMDSKRSDHPRAMIYALSSSVAAMVQSMALRSKGEAESQLWSKEVPDGGREQVYTLQYDYNGDLGMEGEIKLESFDDEQGTSGNAPGVGDHVVKEEPLDFVDQPQRSTQPQQNNSRFYEHMPVAGFDHELGLGGPTSVVKEEPGTDRSYTDPPMQLGFSTELPLPGSTQGLEYPTMEPVDPSVPVRYLDLLGISDAELSMLALLSCPTGSLTLSKICSFIEHFFPERAGQTEGHNYKNSISNSLSNINGRLLASNKIKESARIVNEYHVLPRVRANESARIVNEYHVLPRVRANIMKLTEEMSLIAAIRKSRNVGAHFTKIKSYQHDQSAPYYLQLTRDITQDESIYYNVSTAEPRRKKARASPESYNCVECGEQFDSQLALNTHMSEKRANWFMKKAGLAGESQLIKEEEQEEFACDICEVVSGSSQELKDHIIESHGMKFNCDFCGVEFSLQSDLEAHNKTDAHNAAVLHILNEND